VSLTKDWEPPSKQPYSEQVDCLDFTVVNNFYYCDICEDSLKRACDEVLLKPVLLLNLSADNWERINLMLLSDAILTLTPFTVYIFTLF